MLTKEQALIAREFHYGRCVKRIGPRGGITYNKQVWRRRGQTKTWKTKPHDYAVPVKHGVYEWDHITRYDANHYHIAEECDPIEVYT